VSDRAQIYTVDARVPLVSGEDTCTIHPAPIRTEPSNRFERASFATAERKTIKGHDFFTKDGTLPSEFAKNVIPVDG